MPLGKVVLYAGISAMVWNTLILFVGVAIGSNWEQLRSWFSSYTTVLWVLIAIGIVVVFWLWRRRSIKHQLLTDDTEKQKGGEK